MNMITDMASSGASMVGSGVGAVTSIASGALMNTLAGIGSLAEGVLGQQNDVDSLATLVRTQREQIDTNREALERRGLDVDVASIKVRRESFSPAPARIAKREFAPASGFGAPRDVVVKNSHGHAPQANGNTVVKRSYQRPLAEGFQSFQ